ncbi:MAG: Glycosyl transferase family protein [Parcubacteria group bacterium GW2011_GWE2_38_18]|nr:MAG: Glycosyl transferase family protein [Parcubacteria group bacterium GW2011_GWE2_38_18]
MLDKKVYIGFITYGENTVKYLPYFLPSISSQSYRYSKLYCVDNSENENNQNSQYIKDNFPEIEIYPQKENLGFAKAFNLMINKAIDKKADYFLCLNPDMVFEPDMVEKLVDSINIDEKIGAMMPKILKWDFEKNEKTEIVDSYGLVIDRRHRFFDDYQGLMDDHEVKKIKDIFGFTGAAVLLNLEAMKDIAYKKEYFDELMFMYKEDCDLSYRLRLAGWDIKLISEAVAYHDRTAAIVGQNMLNVALNRKNKNKQLKRWSFLNQLILLYKIKNLPFSLAVKINTYYYLIGSIIFAVIFESYLIKELFKFKKLMSEVEKRSRALKLRVDVKEVERFMKS